MPLLDNFIPSPVFNSGGNVLGAVGGSIPNRDWVRMRQPFLDRKGRACITITDLNGGMTRNDSSGDESKPLLRTYLVNDLRNMGYNLPPVVNATTMRPNDWIQLDKTIVKASRQRLQAVEDLSSASSFGGFNAMGKMTIESQRMSDPGEAVVDMDARTDGRNDTPVFDILSLPLPITHSDFGFSSRELMVSRNSDTPLDTVMAEAAGRRIAESLEDQIIGNTVGVTYGTRSTGPIPHVGTSTVYGYTNFPQRLTKTNFTAPTAGGWVANTTYNEVIAAMQQLYAQFFYGPFVLYHSIDWSPYMDQVFSITGGNNPGETLRTMLKKIPDITDIRRLDRLTSTFTFILVQMTSDVAQMVDGMQTTTIQWEEKGGLELRFKVLAIRVPRLRSDYYERTGILHGTTA